MEGRDKNMSECIDELMECATRCHCRGTTWKYCGVIELHSYNTLATQRSLREPSQMQLGAMVL
jgi:hypothetical protein